MTRVRAGVIVSVCFLVFACAVRLALASQQAPAQAGAPSDPTGAQAQLAEARQLFDALDYEQALVRLDTIVAQLQARRAEPAIQAAITAGPPLTSLRLTGTPAASASASEPAAAQAAAITRALIEALELRARAHFGVGQTEPAREDFRALLTLRADYAPGESVSPRVVAFFQELRSSLLGQVQLTIEPSDAVARIDGIRAGPLGEPLDIVAGPHVLGIVRPGYRPETRDFLVDPGKLAELSVVMTRNASILSVITRPAGVEVKVDGAVKGVTIAPVPPGGTGGAAEAGDGVDSAPLFVPDLGTGSHRIELTRSCYDTAVQTIVVDQLADYRVGPIALKPAVGELHVGSIQAADIYLDGVRRGGAPQALADICAGEHVIEARTASGRDLRRITLKTGERLELTLSPRPALALLGNAGLLSGAPEDVRTRVERALGPASRLFVLSPPVAELRRIEAAERAPAGWLAVGPSGQPGIGGEWRSASAAAARRDLSQRLARALGAQGLVAISRAPERPGMVWLTILAAGAAEPDVIPLELEKPAAALRGIESAAAAGGAPLLRRTLDLSLIDVLHRPGPVVLSGGGLAPGDAVVAVNGQPVATVQDVRRVLEAMGSTRTVAITARSRAGEEKAIDLPLILEPHLVAPLASSAPALASSSNGATRPAGANLLLLELRSRLSEAVGPEATAVRLNLASALTGAGDPEGALALLDEVAPANGPASAATVTVALAQLLRAMALDGLGRAEEAQRAWQAALAASPATASTLDDAPSVHALATQRLRATGPRPPQR